MKKTKNKIMLALASSAILLTPFSIASCSSVNNNENENKTETVENIDKAIILETKFNNQSSSSTVVSDINNNFINIKYNKPEVYGIEIKLNDSYPNPIFGNLGFNNPKITYAIKDNKDSSKFTIRNNSYVIGTNLSPDTQNYLVEVEGTISEKGYETQKFIFTIKLENEHIPSSIKPTTKPFDVNEDVISSVKISNSNQISIDDSGTKKLTINFSQSTSYDIEIFLNNMYSVFGSLGFSKPKISFTTTTSNFKITNSDGTYLLTNINQISQNIKNTKIVVIVNIEESGYQSQVFDFEIELVNSYEEVKPPIDGDKPRLNVDYTLAPNTPSDQVNNRDYWITNPFTQNQEILKQWGSVPLPMKDTLTKADLEHYFLTNVINEWSFPVSFGQRNIDSEFFINTYIEWIVRNWKYFPWISYHNPAPQFVNREKYTVDILKENKDNILGYFDSNKFHIKENKPFNYLEKITWPSKQRDAYLKAIKIFFSNYVRPGMNDLDKILAVYMFVTQWTSYVSTNKNDGYSFWVENGSICTHYGEISALLLNILGVPAISMGTAALIGSGADPHAVTWIWTNADGTNEKKWYLMDATFSDMGNNQTPEITLERHRGTEGAGGPWDFFLQSVSENEWGTSWDSKREAQHNNFYQYYLGTWFTPWKNKQVKTGNFKFKNRSSLISRLYHGGQSDYWSNSRPIFYNGYWYLLAKDGYNINFYKSKIDMGGEMEKVHIPDRIYNQLSTVSRYANVGMAQYRDWVLMIDNRTPDFYSNNPSLSGNRKIILHNMNDADWSNAEVIDIPSDVVLFEHNGVKYKANDAKLDTFYVEDEKLKIKYSFYSYNAYLGTKTVEMDIPKIKFSQDTYLRQGDVEVAKMYFAMAGNTHRIGNDNYEMSLEEKKEYNDFIENYSSTNTSVRNQILELNKRYQDLLSKISKNSEKYIISDVINDLYTTNKNSFEQYGLSIPFRSGYESFSRLSKDEFNPSIKYDIYFSKEENGTYDKIASKMYEIHLESSHFYNHNGDPTGYYYIECFLGDMSILTTRKFQVIMDSTKDGLPIANRLEVAWEDNNQIYKKTKSNTNYLEFVPDWYDRRMKLYNEFVNTNPSEYTSNLYLKFLSFNSKKIETLRSELSIQHQQSIKIEYELGHINEKNKGIYFIEIHSQSIKTKKTYKSYSQLTYILTKSDVESNNFLEWVDLSKQVDAAANNPLTKRSRKETE